MHQDNAPSHNCTLVSEWLARNRTIVMQHCPWSPDLAPNDLWAFPRVKKDMKDKHWGTVEEIEQATTNSLKALMVEEFQDCFQQWERRWTKCIELEGNYFESDRIDFVDYV